MKKTIDQTFESNPFDNDATPTVDRTQTLCSLLRFQPENKNFIDSVRCTKFSNWFTKTRHESTKQNVPDRPIPALQCTMAGPTSALSALESRT